MEPNKRRTPLVVAVEKVSPAVVNIYTISETPQRNQLIDDPFLRKFFNLQTISLILTESLLLCLASHIEGLLQL